MGRILRRKPLTPTSNLSWVDFFSKDTCYPSPPPVIPMSTLSHMKFKSKSSKDSLPHPQYILTSFPAALVRILKVVVE